MITKLRCGAVGALFAAALGTGSAAQAADNADAEAFAEILQALTLEVQTNTQLDFGQLVLPTAGGGQVSLAADGTLTCVDPDIICSGTTGVPTFLVSGGSAGKAVTVNLPSAASKLLRNGGTSGVSQDEIELDSFVTSAPSDEVTLDAVGAAAFTVGGTITIDGDETPGLFEGTFNVSVEYS